MRRSLNHVPSRLDSAVRSPWSLGTAAIVVGFLFLVMTGVGVMTAGTMTLAVAWQSAGGYILWRALRSESSPLEALGMGIAIGTGVSALAGVASATAGLGPWGSLTPTAFVLAWLAARPTRLTSTKPRSPGAAETLDRGQWTALAVGLAGGGAVLLYAIRSYPLTWTGIWSGYHPDMPFFEALATSLARFGALSSPFMTGGTIRYHWLTYAWTGQLSVLTDAAPFVGLTRVLPVVALVGCLALVVSWSRRLSSTNWTPVLAALLLTISGFTGAVFGGVLTMDSPSQSIAVLWLLGFSITIMHWISRAMSGAANLLRRTAVLALACVLMIAMTGGKVSAAAPALAGTLLLALVLRARGQATTRDALALTGVATVGFVIGAAIFLMGSAESGGLEIGLILDKVSSEQGLNPLPGQRAVLLGTGILILAILPRWAGLFSLSSNRAWRWRPETIYSWGLALSSLVALLALSGANTIWFSSTVSGPLAVTSAVGCALAVTRLRRSDETSSKRTLMVAALFTLGTITLVWLAWGTGDSGGNLFTYTWRWAGPLVAWIGALSAGVVLALHRDSQRAWVLIGAGAVVVLVFTSVPGRLLGVGSGQAGMLTSGMRTEWFGPSGITTLPGIDTEPRGAWTSAELRAAEWLRSNSEPTDVLATNVTLGPLVPGLTRLPTFVSGMRYQQAYGPPSVGQELLLREAAAWRFIDEPSREAIAPLCAAGVRWLWIDPSRTPATVWEPFARVVTVEDGVVIAELDRDQCAT